MKVKIGSVIYDAEVDPIMLILTDEDKENIKKMGKDATKFCAAPLDMDINELKEFMKTEKNK